jgi:aspartokinase-like uncharacterized kinase
VLAGLKGDRVFLFPGGGSAANAVRELDCRHGLGETASHWLALRALTVNAYFLYELLPELPVVSWPQVGDGGILEPYALASSDEVNSEHLPHCWEVTSDSLAVRAAVILGAGHLLLLKSVTVAPAMTWEAAERSEIVDAFFSRALKQAPKLNVRVVNLRMAGGWSLDHRA